MRSMHLPPPWLIRAALSSALSSAPWVGTLALSACAVAPEPVAETLPPGPERARRALDALVDGLALRSPGATLAHVAEVWTVEGGSITCGLASRCPACSA
jgi:hypothetical protein